MSSEDTSTFLILLIVYLPPVLYAIMKGLRRIARHSHLGFQFNLADLVILPFALMPSMYAILVSTQYWPFRGIFVLYQLTGIFWGTCTFFERRGGMYSAVGLLIGAFMGALIFGFWSMVLLLVSVIFFQAGADTACIKNSEP